MMIHEEFLHRLMVKGGGDDWLSLSVLCCEQTAKPDTDPGGWRGHKGLLLLQCSMSREQGAGAREQLEQAIKVVLQDWSQDWEDLLLTGFNAHMCTCEKR